MGSPCCCGARLVFGFQVEVVRIAAEVERGEAWGGKGGSRVQHSPSSLQEQQQGADSNKTLTPNRNRILLAASLRLTKHRRRSG